MPDLPAMVARTVSKLEAKTNPKCKEALDKEWKKLENPENPAWDLSSVREKKTVMAEAVMQKQAIHLGSLMALCHLKNAQNQTRI